MDAQDTIQDTVQEQSEWAGITEQLRELRELYKQVEGTGAYIPFPTEALIKRAEVYFNQYHADILAMLRTAGITDDTADTVTQDYCSVLLGGCYQLALPFEKQADVINAVKPWQLLLTERYGLNLLFTIYFHNVQAAREYIEGFKLADGHITRIKIHRENGENVREQETIKTTVEEQKRQFLNRRVARIMAQTTPLFAGADNWIRKAKWHDGGMLVEPSDFSGVEPELTNRYLAFVSVFSGIDEYVNYYYIAKYALKATPDELKEINFPSLFETYEQAQEHAERVSTVRYKHLLRRVAEVEKALNAETVEEREQARKEVINESPEQEERIKIPENIALLGSRDVYASVNGTQITEQGVIPISKVITIYGQRKGELPANVTPLTVERTIQGLNMLQRFNHNAPVGGWYTYETNITEFSKLCGYDNANGVEMTAIMHCLMILRDLYVIVWKPKGRVAMQLLTVPEIGVSGELKGQFKLQVSAVALGGHQNFITLSQYNTLRKQAKGQAISHFNAQLIAKGQKEENALLNEVFGYDTMILEATGYTGNERTNPEAVRNVREFIRKNKPKHRKQIARWFEEYTKNGVLESYSRELNKKGEYVYKWRRVAPPKEITTAEPDEQDNNA